MKVLHLNTNDTSGSGKAVLRLHYGLKALGVNSKILTLYSASGDGDVIVFERSGNILGRALTKLNNTFIANEVNKYSRTMQKTGEIFSDGKAVFGVDRHDLFKWADIIHLHWVPGMLDYAKPLSNVGRKAIVWTLHDMNPFTGGCHYTGDCEKYRENCGTCPKLGSQKPFDLSNKIWRRKKNGYAKLKKLQLVASSRWLKACAGKSALFKKHTVNCIHYSLPIDIFTIRDKDVSRDIFGLPHDKRLILFGSDYKTERKGLKYLMDALKILENRIDISSLALGVFGPYEAKDVDYYNLKIPIYSFGYINSDAKLSYLYNAASVFVIPSVEENLAQTCLEAMASGVPIVGFNVGGMKEIVEQGITGFLVEPKDAGALAERMFFLLKNPELCEHIGRNARKLVEERFDLKTQAKKYIDIYKSLLIRI